MNNPFREKSSGNRGKKLEKIIRDSIKYHIFNGEIPEDFWDKPKKFIAETKRLIGDFWFLTESGNFYLYECKETTTDYYFPLSRLEPHQKRNIITADKIAHCHGNLALWFPTFDKKYIKIIPGRDLEHYTKHNIAFDEQIGYRLEIQTKTINNKPVKIINLF